MKILISYDGSKDSKYALDQAIQMVKNSENTLYILTIRTPLTTFQYSSNVPFSDPDLDTGDLNMAHIRERLESREHAHWQGVLNEAKTICRETGIEYRGFLVTGDPRTTICDVAKQENVDMIIMGSRGFSSLKGLILGSASQYTVKHAPCAVLIARPKS